MHTHLERRNLAVHWARHNAGVNEVINILNLRLQPACWRQVDVADGTYWASFLGYELAIQPGLLPALLDQRL